MIADRRPASPRLETQQPDRCPCARPFSADFAGCATFHPLGFVGVDSLNRPLAASLTCRHLTVGANGHPGRFYPRCDLGAPEERKRWLAGVGPERVAVTAALQEELDAATQADREALHATKAALLAAPDDPAARQRFERALRLYITTVRSFVLDNQARLDDVGLGAETMVDLVDEWARAWADTRGGVAHLLRDLGDLVAPSQALPAPAPVDGEERHLVGHRTAEPLPRAGSPLPPASRTADPGSPFVLLDTPALRVVRSADRRRLQVAGDIDATNAAAFAEVLAKAATGSGDCHVDLGGVLFCDVAGLRALVTAAQRLEPERRLVLHRVPAHVRRALAVAGWSELASIAVVRDGSARP